MASASVQTVPAMVERAGQITAAQRAAVSTPKAAVWRRVQGIVPIVGPVILSSIAEVEERTMALEARGFTQPGAGHCSGAPPDSGLEALARWTLVLALGRSSPRASAAGSE